MRLSSHALVYPSVKSKAVVFLKSLVLFFNIDPSGRFCILINYVTINTSGCYNSIICLESEMYVLE